MNIRDRRAITDSAKQSLANAKGDPKKILLIYLAIVTGLSLAVALISMLLSNRIADTGGLGNMGLRSVLSTAKSILPMLQSIILLGLEIGYCTMALNITRGAPVSNDTLFGGFRRFFPLLRAQILMSLLYLGLGLLSVYPGAYLFLMLPISKKFYEAFTPVMESASQLTGTLTIDEATMAILSEAMQPALWIMGALFMVLFIPTHYRYRMVTYRLIDQPHPGALRALRESRTMMRRNRFALFRLDLKLWWFYALQGLTVALCYGDMLIPALGITLPWSENVTYFVFLSLSLLVQFVTYYLFMNRVSVTYATAYTTLIPQEQSKTTTPANPWQNRY